MAATSALAAMTRKIMVANIEVFGDLAIASLIRKGFPGSSLWSLV